MLAEGLAGYSGVRRRFELKGTAAGVRVYDDYAHHPTEVAATIAAARGLVGPGRLVVVFQPHLYSRTAAFADGFGAALAAADVVVVLDVYGAREDPQPGISGELVADAVPPGTARVHYEPSLSAAPPVDHRDPATGRPGDHHGGRRRDHARPAVVGPAAAGCAVTDSARTQRARTALIDVTADDQDDLVDDDGPEQTLPRRRWPLRLALGLTIGLLLAAAYVVGASPVLALRGVVVNGSGAPTLSDQVRSAVAVADGTPLALINLGGVHDRVAAVGPVASVAVQRRWPHTLVVTVTARAPVAVTQANGRWWLLDATGKPYQPVSGPARDADQAGAGDARAGDPATLASLGVLGYLQPAMRKAVASIAAPSAYAITLKLADGRTVLWGSDTQNALKAQVLPALLTRPGTSFDISDPTLVTVR